jgi:predicted metal-dependent hydrolase
VGVVCVNLLETPEFIAALELWRRGEFWEVHEALEPLWMRLAGPGREFTQGVILLAAALHKAKSSPSGGWRNFAKALRHLEMIPPTYQGVRVAELIEEVRAALRDPDRLPAFPRLL